VTDRFHGGRWFVTVAGRRHATPLLLALAAIVFADLAFAIDSIPAAFAVTRDPLLIWMANVFALLGLRALFVLVEGLARRLRYMDETIALVLGAVAVKLLVEDLVHISPGISLAVVAAIFLGGIGASLLADRRDGRRPGAATRGPEASGWRRAEKSGRPPIPAAALGGDPADGENGRRNGREPDERNGGAERAAGSPATSG
jgi:predicted tellurium resistance membrane protein TerC